ncbi:hypothetical protein ATHSA_1524 [Athalassotoga saccharophila]|nr:hypothetical protein ATHSA_1524 [Athalassotoga saccharophila]
MRNAIVIFLVICLIGSSFAFASQGSATTVATAVPITKSAQHNSAIDFLIQLPEMTVKYLMPIEMVLSAVPIIGIIPTSLFFLQLIIFLFPLYILQML